jgi:hypothetical protein
MKPFQIACVAFFLALVGVAHAEPGHLIRYEKVATYSKDAIDQTKLLLGIDAQSGLYPSRAGAVAYKLNYETTGVAGQPETASGLLLVPDTSAVRALPLLSFQHGTVTDREDAPSRIAHPENAPAEILYGSMGYIVSSPDYLGLGDGPGPHPFLHAATEASAARDLLIAVRQALPQLGVTLNGKFFLAGYSQGGHATMALHRALERDPLPGLKLTASVPMAGPYDLSDTSFHSTLDHPTVNSPVYVAYLLSMLARTDPARVPSLAAIVGPDLEERILRLFDGTYNGGEISTELPRDPKDLFLPEVLARVQADPNHPVRQALAANNVYNWKPLAPILLLHASGDPDVSFANSRKAFATLHAQGATISLEDLGADKDHYTAFAPAVALSFKFIETK